MYAQIECFPVFDYGFVDSGEEYIVDTSEFFHGQDEQTVIFSGIAAYEGG